MTMTSRLFSVVLSVSLLILVALMAGCASAPQERFHTLSAGLRAGAVASRGPGPSVLVAPAALPEQVDRPQLVLVRGPARRITILEQQRWAEPLRTGIARVVAEDLGALLGSDQVSVRDKVLREPDCRIDLDVRRFDAADRVVSVAALWRLECVGAPPRTGHWAGEEAITGRGLDATLVSYGRALDALSRTLAAEISRPRLTQD